MAGDRRHPHRMDIKMEIDVEEDDLGISSQPPMNSKFEKLPSAKDFPLLRLIDPTVVGLDPNFKPEGSRKRLQKVIEMVYINDEDEEEVFDLDQLIDPNLCSWSTGFSFQVKMEAEEATMGKDPDDTFEALPEEQVVTLSSKKYPIIKVEDDEEDEVVFIDQRSTKVPVPSVSMAPDSQSANKSPVALVEISDIGTSDVLAVPVDQLFFKCEEEETEKTHGQFEVGNLYPPHSSRETLPDKKSHFFTLSTTPLFPIQPPAEYSRQSKQMLGKLKQVTIRPRKVSPSHPFLFPFIPDSSFKCLAKPVPIKP